MTGTLASPLARALDEGLSAVDDEWTVQEMVDLALAALRTDPEVVGVLAEALHEADDCTFLTNADLDVEDHKRLAAALLDALLGPKA